MVPWILATAGAWATPIDVPQDSSLQDAIDGNCATPCILNLSGSSYPGTFTVASTQDVTIQANSATLGGGITISGGTLTLSEGEFASTTVTPALSVEAGGDLVLIEVDAHDFVDPTLQSEGALLRVSGGASTAQIIGGAAEGLGAESGGAIHIDGGTLVIENVAFLENNASAGDGGAIQVEGGDVTLRGATFDGNRTSPLIPSAGGGAIGLRGGTLLIESSTFTDNRSDAGGAIFVGGGTLTVTGSVFSANGSFGPANGTGGAISEEFDFAGYPDVVLSTSIFDHNEAGFLGGALALGYGHAAVEDCVFEQNWSGGFGGGGGAIHAGGLQTFSVVRSRFTDDATGGSGGAVQLGYTVTRALIADNRFERTSSGVGGGALGLAAAHATVTRNTYCRTETPGMGGAVYVWGSGDVSISNEIIAETSATRGGALGITDGRVEVGHLTVHTPSAGLGAVASVDGYGELDLAASLVGHLDGTAFHAPTGNITLHDVVFDPPPPSYGAVDPSDATEAPIQWLVSVADPEDEPCPPFEFRIHPDAAQFGAYSEGNGSWTDLGAFGGIDLASPWGDDEDGDGVGWIYDCDEQDPNVHGFAVEWCNDMDDDCDGLTDERSPAWAPDVDGDGYGSDDQGCIEPGTDAVPYDPYQLDCDDADPAIHPGAADPPGDSIDQDCDGSDTGTAGTGTTGTTETPFTPRGGGPTQLAGGRCGCGANGAAPSLLGLLLPAVLRRRRQRNQQ